MSSEWALLWRLALALALSSAIGVERELRRKSAGLRTHSLVGLGAALFVLVSTELGELDGVLAVSGIDVSGASD